MGGRLCSENMGNRSYIRFRKDYFDTVEQERQMQEFVKGNLKPHSSRIRVRERLWENQMLTILWQSILEWEPGYQISFKGNRKPMIAKLIQPISFPSLKKINLAGNGLDSVEPLSRVWVPNLQILQLGSTQVGNNITDIKNLRKIYSPYLFDIVLYQNKTKESSAIANFMSSKIRFVYLQTPSNQTQNDCDMSWLLKLPKNSPLTIDISHPRKISQKKVMECLYRRMKPLKLHLFYKQ